jgi:hypothetical protein
MGRVACLCPIGGHVAEAQRLESSLAQVKSSDLTRIGSLRPLA